MTWVAGVDGCRGGWYVAVWDPEGRRVQGQVCPTFTDVLRATHDCSVVAVDIPIGLPDSGDRLCDQEARKRLGWPRRSSVFPAPLRTMLKADTHAEASKIGKDIDNRGLTAQTWNILKKIREVDQAMSPEHQRQRPQQVVEIHPEMCFWRLTGTPLSVRKGKREGFAQRRAALRQVFPDSQIEKLLSEREHSQVGKDDVLDALVAAWTARRKQEDVAGRIPADPPVDTCGLRMEMWF